MQIGCVTHQETSIAKTDLHWTPIRKKEGPPQDLAATDSGERYQGDREDLERHQVYGKRPADWGEHVAVHLGGKRTSE